MILRFSRLGVSFSSPALALSACAQGGFLRDGDAVNLKRPSKGGIGCRLRPPPASPIFNPGGRRPRSLCRGSVDAGTDRPQATLDGSGAMAAEQHRVCPSLIEGHADEQGTRGIQPRPSGRAARGGASAGLPRQPRLFLPIVSNTISFGKGTPARGSARTKSLLPSEPSRRGRVVFLRAPGCDAIAPRSSSLPSASGLAAPMAVRGRTGAQTLADIRQELSVLFRRVAAPARRVEHHQRRDGVGRGWARFLFACRCDRGRIAPPHPPLTEDLQIRIDRVVTDGTKTGGRRPGVPAVRAGGRV